MGTSIENVYFARSLADQGVIPKDTFVIDLGAQEFNEGVDIFKLYDAMSEFLPEGQLSELTVKDVAKLRFSGPIFERLGFKYLALDVYRANGCMVFDLNHDAVPESLKGAGHLVQNFGTTEHVFNQANCFQVIHDLTSPDGGIMWHCLPMSDYHYHGFYKYDYKFFERLMIANDYEIVFVRFDRVPGSRPVPKLLFENGLPPTECLDTGVNIMLRRTSPAPFRFPIDYDDTKLGVRAAPQQAVAGA